MSIHILGIRHHGPGSARNVKTFLEQLQPDVVLVEGPPEGDDLLRWSQHSELKPPVAILAFRPDKPAQAVFYPFAEFSPEWQAIQYGATQRVPVRFMDLPLVYRFAFGSEQAPPAEGLESTATPPVEEDVAALDDHRDPLRHLAEAAGFDDGERWWDQMFEQRVNNDDIFEAVNEAMRSLRQTLPAREDRTEKLREAYMRKVIRQSEKEGYQKIAVICGAWHAPALETMPKQKDDEALLKGLPKVKVETTWIPWTYNRLSFASGYGAGILSPGWYHHVWNFPNDDGTQWMTNVARLFRSRDIDTSVAHIIEAVRLAESLASLRGRSKAGLDELNEAALAVLCGGEPILLELIREALIVSDTIGTVPPAIPQPPLLQDVEKTQKRLRLPAEAGIKEIVLDLRESLHLERSIFLHRLLLLEITWGHLQQVRSKGTFKEQWQLKWEPEYSIRIIEKGNWGNTLEEAVTQYVANEAGGAATLGVVSGLLEKVIPAALPRATEALIARIDGLAAATGDVLQLLEVLPPLATASRYGNVRQTDQEMLLGIIQSMVARVCVSLPPACVSIDDDAAATITVHLHQLSDTIALLDIPEQRQAWHETLQQIADHNQTAPLLSGYSTRLLADAHEIDSNELEARFARALSRAGNPAVAASWIEGFLKGSGSLLILDQRLWSLVNQWVRDLQEPDFVALLPLMRRTFSQFSHAERRKIGEKARQEDSGAAPAEALDTAALDPARAQLGLPVVLQLLGMQRAGADEPALLP
ncbi:DUF5682 family protein [Dawidia soli]|uniref:Uncharacterized protein n=1 Tax=Dawidia soli TaxID=2782352 RepID=A0AAP2DG82_9BACT|nr:DUF5682 family protein [Dawidia soli]MBT1688782.1 hypothetical protein [Dawidia soli]